MINNRSFSLFSLIQSSVFFLLVTSLIYIRECHGDEKNVTTSTVCEKGYHLEANGNCVKINECDDKTPCRNYKICVNFSGHYRCMSRCKNGWRFSGKMKKCLDINECRHKPMVCKSNERCVNTWGSFRCDCESGFRRNVSSNICDDINECQEMGHAACPPIEKCVNTIGNYSCTENVSCPVGYTFNEVTEICEDNDKCVLGNCSNGYRCRNLNGTFICDPNSEQNVTKLRKNCPRGYYNDPYGQCVKKHHPIVLKKRYRWEKKCSVGHRPDPFNNNECIDIDECAVPTTCGLNQKCINYPGSYICRCLPGYRLDSNDNCVDIDECNPCIYQSNMNICGTYGECVNTIGSYHCVCNVGFENINKTNSSYCWDIDECSKTSEMCPHHECINTWGNYECNCKPGFRLNVDKNTCTDIDECLENKDTDLCDHICTNTPGSYVCECPDGYELDVDGKTCEDINECDFDSICQHPNDICVNTKGSHRCIRMDCPTGYKSFQGQINQCLRYDTTCNADDLICLHKPIQIIYNFTSLTSMHPTSQNKSLTLFNSTSSMMKLLSANFTLTVVNTYSPLHNTTATESYFHLQQTARSTAIISLIRNIEGPQEIELELRKQIFLNSTLVAKVITKLFIFVSQYEF